MPIKNAFEPPKKRPRIETTKFSNASQIRSALFSDSNEKLKEALTYLRNQLAVKVQESSVSPQDERLNLVKQWLESSPGAYDLIELWDSTVLRNSSIIALVLSLLSSILSLLTAHYNDHVLGQPIMKTLLTPSRLRILNSYIGGSNNELVIVVLKLYNVMSNFAGGRDKKAVLEGFGWEIKSLPKLLNMRRKTHGERDTTDPLLRPDIRTLYILFLLSFVDTDSLSQTKTLFLEQHREAFLAIFKGLIYDHYSLARKILEVCWGGIWSDSKVKRTLKVGLFNEATLGHIIKLYERTSIEDDDEDHIPANLVHHFLLAICTRPGTGICFRDRGWYPRELDSEDSAKASDDGRKKSSKIYNKILANILKTLKVNEDARQQELAIKTLAACPELVAGYWSAVALTLEPRLSSKWITNIAIFGSIISLPIPSSTLFLPNDQLYEPTPPPLSAVIENILPSVNTKHNFSKGLQSTSGLVQHCTALALSRCLVKYQAVREQFRKVALALEEDEEDGQWNKRCNELERDVRRRVPEFQVLIAFSQQKNDPKIPSNPTKSALLAESAQRLLWLYQHCLPSVVAEARFDVSKLLHTFSPEDTTEGDADEHQSSFRLHRVQKLHILGLLKESDQFTWTGKIPSLSYSPFYILLSALSSANLPALRKALASVLTTVLSQSILFEEDKSEPDLWLSILPRKSVHLQNTCSIFHGEAEGVIAFVDECVQRCIKTPYRYVEALNMLDGSSATAAQLSMYPSPLLMTIIEQLDAKISNKSLLPSHILGIVSYIRKLIFNLTTKTTDLGFLRKYSNKLYAIVREERLPATTEELHAAVNREKDILRVTLTFNTHTSLDQRHIDDTVERYLDNLENSSLPESEAHRSNEANSVVHWMRTLAQPIGTSGLRRLAAIIYARDTSLVPSLIENLIPGQADSWKAFDLMSPFSDFLRYFSFQQLYINTGTEQIMEDNYRTILTDILFARNPTFTAVSRNIHFIMHHVNAVRQKDKILSGHIALLARVLKAAITNLSTKEANDLKKEVFVNFNTLKSITTSSPSVEVLTELQHLLECIDPGSSDDCILISNSSNYWFDVLKGGLTTISPAMISTASLWIKYLQADRLFELLDSLVTAGQAALLASLQIADAVLEALKLIGSLESSAESALVERLPQLLSLRTIMSNSTLLEDVIAMAVQATLPVGVDGCPSSVSSFSANIEDVIQRSETRWSRRLRSTKIDLDLHTFLTQKTISHSTVKIISGLIYQRSYSSTVLSDWLRSSQCQALDAEYLLPILHALLDSSDTTVLALPIDIWLPFVAACVKVLASASSKGPEVRNHACFCLAGILSLHAHGNEELLVSFSQEVQSVPEKKVTLDLISCGIVISSKLGSKSNNAISHLLDKGIQRCIDNSTLDQETSDTTTLADTLHILLQRAPVAKAHLVETLLTVTIQHRLWSISALRLAITCLASCQLKPVTVNRNLQSIIQHPHFFRVCSSSSSDSSNLRETLIELLYRLFNLHPTNTCQVTHIEPLIKVYRGTLANSDLRILAIFQLFEGQKKLSVAPLLGRWSGTSNITSHTALEALQSLDSVIVLRTCLNFPRWRRLSDQSETIVDAEGYVLYDPIFLMLMFSQIISDQPPSSAFGWIELFRTNVVSLFIRALSSRDGHIRDLALCQIVALWKHMETADLQERPHVLYILNLLKDLLPPPIPTNAAANIDFPPRLPTYTTLLLMHSLRAVFNPSNFIYPITARFLLQRPSLDISDVPMLYGLLYSSADDSWKKERTWIIKFLADGMVSSEDWRILKRRHTWDLLASLFQSSTKPEDAPLRAAILEVLSNLTCNAQATTSLILKSALLPWIEMQILNPGTRALGREWISILENILVIVNAPKIETSTNGEWRVIICRCLKYLLDDKYSTNADAIFPCAVPAILRLSLLQGPVLYDLPTLLDLATTHLGVLEAKIHLDGASSMLWRPKTVIRNPPYHSLTIHQPMPMDDLNSLQQFQHLLELLWRATMAASRKCDAWDKLTVRLLVLGGYFMKGLDDDVAEWARVEVIRNLA